MNNRQRLLTAVNLAGSQAALAAKINAENGNVLLKQAHIWKWLNASKDGIPEKQVIPCCRAFAFSIRPHDLRPDIYPHPDDGLPDHMRMQTSAQTNVQALHE